MALAVTSGAVLAVGGVQFANAGTSHSKSEAKPPGEAVSAAYAKA